MGSVMAIIVAILVTGGAFLIKHFLLGVLEDDHHFKIMVGSFFLVYILAALTVGLLLPKPTELGPMADISLPEVSWSAFVARLSE